MTCHPYPGPTFRTARQALAGAVDDAVAYRCTTHNGWHITLPQFVPAGIPKENTMTDSAEVA